MSTLAYPPIINNKLPAFIKSNDGTVISVPFKLSKAVSYSDFTHMQLRLKTITSGLEKVTHMTPKSAISYNSVTNLYTAAFSLTTTEHDKLVIGQFYKAQLAFIHESYSKTTDTTQISGKIYYTYNSETKQYTQFTGSSFTSGTDYYIKTVLASPYSEVGIIKCTGQPTITIDNLSIELNNNNPVDFIGKYVNRDTTEKVYSYCFTIYDNMNQIYDTSGTLVHNSNSDTMNTITDETATPSTWSEYNAYDQWSSKKGLTKGLTYTIVYSITTINDYTIESAPYVIRENDTIDASIPAILLAEPDNENGCVSLSLVKRPDLNAETAFSGNFVISRYDSNTQQWNEICRFNALSQTPSQLGILWTDYTIEHGVRYLYSIQAYNSNNLYSNRLTHVLRHPNYENQYVSVDIYNNPCYILADFEDAFLTDGERQLKIKYNPKVSTFKPTILESKLDTIGGKYPFIFRNGNVNYKELAISGMLSYLGDEKELFMSGLHDAEANAIRVKTAATNIPTHLRNYDSVYTSTALTSDNFYRERQFKLEALKWLTNGQPKLFRSPGEGNYIVRLMNVSLAPNDTVGRMLHTFNATAYEIADCNHENLVKYALFSIPEVENRTMKFKEEAIGALLETEFPMYNAVITEASSGTEYQVSFVGENAGPAQSLVIGATGTYYFSQDALPISKLTKVSGDIYGTAKVTYGYYDLSVPDNFSYIANITSVDETAQFIGENENTEIITTYIEDIRRTMGNVYSLQICPRDIVPLYTSGGKYYSDTACSLEYTTWSDLIIYKINSNAYYSGHPNNNKYLGTTEPEYACKINNEFILDLSTGNTYPPFASSNFIPLTRSCYQIKNDFGTISAIHLTPGVYINISYELKEIEYSIDSEDLTVKTLKDAWKSARDGYIAGTEGYTLEAMQTAYSSYLEGLEEALTELYKEGDAYAL